VSLPADPDTLLGVVYLSGYLTVAVAGMARELRERDMPRWLFALSGATMVAESAGMFLYLAELAPPLLARVWAPVFVLIVAANALEMRFAYRTLVREPEPDLEEEDVRSTSALAVAATLVVGLPSLYMNLRLALG
jgi:hypothetical protein